MRAWRDVNALGVVLLIIGMALAWPAENRVSFGPEEEIYYENGATEADARRLGSALESLGLFDGHQSASVVISRRGTSLAACFVVDDNAWKDSTVVQYYQDVRTYLNSGPFADTPLLVQLCDVLLRTRAVIVKPTA